MKPITLEGEAALTKALKSYEASTLAKIHDAVKVTAMSIGADAINSIQRGAKTGRIYAKGNGITHQASAAGQAPATDEDGLVASIYSVTKTYDAWIGSDLDYAEWLEFGTTKIKARPWLKPARERGMKKFRERLKRAIS